MSQCTLQSVLDTLPSGWIVVGMKTFLHLPPGHTAYAVDLRKPATGEGVSSYEFSADAAWDKACDIAQACDRMRTVPGGA